MFTAGLLAQATDSEARDEDNVVVRGKKKCKAVHLSDLTVELFEGSGDTNAEFAGATGTTNTAATVAFQCDHPDFFVSHSWHDDFQRYARFPRASNARMHHSPLVPLLLNV